jgi:hypothetical protein
MSNSHRSTPLHNIPQELTYIDVQNGTAKVLYPSLLKAVDWLVSKGLADSRLKAALRKAVPRA